MIETDVCIVGAGPAGASAALHLSYAGIGSVIVDKAVFPRDKICGDGINGKVPELLKQLDPELYERFHAQADIHIGTWGIRLFAHNSSILEAPFYKWYDVKAHRPPGYICKRLQFDNFFIEEIKRRSNIRFFDNTPIEHYTRISDGFQVSNKDGSFSVKTKILVIANGSDAAFTRRYMRQEPQLKHHAAAVRGYFTNVAGFHPDNFVEFYFIDKLVPGYLWIFPHPNGLANVGLGMRTDLVRKKKSDLKAMLMDVIRHHPVISKRFKASELVGNKLIGHTVPLGSGKFRRSGDHFLLVGDAASLVDPLTGGGIANSFLSGKLAARQIADCLEQNNYAAGFMQAYDRQINRQIGKGMRKSYLLQYLLRYPLLTRSAINFVAGHPALFDFLSRLQMKLVAGK